MVETLGSIYESAASEPNSLKIFIHYIHHTHLAIY